MYVCPKEELGCYLTESKNLCGLDVSMLKTALKIHHLFAFPCLITSTLSSALYWDAVLGILKFVDVLPVFIVSDVKTTWKNLECYLISNLKKKLGSQITSGLEEQW